MPEADRRAALNLLAPTAEDRGKVLMRTAKNTRFDPASTAKAITPFLLELPIEAVFAISGELDDLLESPSKELRSAAVVLKVRSGSSLESLADIDAQALLSAVQSLPKAMAPENVPTDMIALAEAGKVHAGFAFSEAVRLSSDTGALFERFSILLKKAQELGYDQWGQTHQLAMAALGAMHSIEDAQWPAGFEDYKIARADTDTLKLGHDVYHHEEAGCVKCHGDKGQGAEGFPPLAGSPNLLGNPMRPATIVKYGLMGELSHTLNPADGKPFNAQMEPLSNLSDTDMAAAITYARQNWGNFAEPVTVEHLAAAKSPKAEKGEGENMWKAEALLSKFPFRKDTVLGSMPLEIKVIKWKTPAGGLFYMLAAVTVCMAMILFGTMFGGGATAHSDHAGPAVA